MSDLSFLEKMKLEKILSMDSGYVLDFSNRTFQEFIADCIGINIYDNKYEKASGSKANRLRALWEIEPNYRVGKLIDGLLELLNYDSNLGSSELLNECSRIAERLQQGAPVIESVDSILDDRNFEAVERSVKQAIDRNEPESALDHLHTYVVKYLRSICNKRGIKVTRKKPLHSLLGEYVNCMKQLGLIEANMTERILKSMTLSMEAFNRVRNEHSLAHDNPILNYNESLLIFNYVSSSVRFIETLERQADELAASEDVEEYNIPF